MTARVNPPWPDWDWPPVLNEWQREVAVYSHLQQQVRFTGGPVVGKGRASTAWFCGVPRPIRQQAYRSYGK